MVGLGVTAVLCCAVLTLFGGSFLAPPRATAATAMNEVSSRSHAIFTIHITVTVTTKLSHGGGRTQDGKGEGVDSDGEAENDVRWDLNARH